MKITALPLLKVRLVIVPILHTAALFPVIVQVPVPIVMARVLELDEENIPIVTFLLFASKVPLVKVRVREEPIVR